MLPEKPAYLSVPYPADRREEEFSLKHMYTPPRRNPGSVKYDKTVAAFANHRHRPEDVGYALPLATGPKAQVGAVLSGIEQFQVFAKTTPYPQFYTEMNLIDGYMDYIQKFIPKDRPWRYVELGVGGGEKTERLLEGMRDNPPDTVILNDNSQSIIDTATKRIERIIRENRLEKRRTFKIKSASGDFLADKTWRTITHHLDEVQRVEGVATVVFGNFGVTWNDLAEQDKVYMLKQIGKRGAHFLVSVDHTRDPIALAKFYDHAPLHDMMVSAVAWHDMMTDSYKPYAIDHARLQGALQIENTGGLTGDAKSTVRFLVYNDPSKLVLVADDIYKESPHVTVPTFEDCGFEVARRLFPSDKIIAMPITAPPEVGLTPEMATRIRENMEHYAGGIYHLRNPHRF